MAKIELFSDTKAFALVIKGGDFKIPEEAAKSAEALMTHPIFGGQTRPDAIRITGETGVLFDNTDLPKSE